MFPARAGMSPTWENAGLYPFGVPRASGDEPEDNHWGRVLGMCSPCERDEPGDDWSGRVGLVCSPRERG